ncbi:hypothetical protein Ciccas_012401 [Cichlidogyrus casuarinus]|uniref:Sema domain-containing protein n=1 Tax=Cichlidogyrus casuarinus TaxID=1844966 RepID=A0ABD2PQU0_9PLAT
MDCRLYHTPADLCNSNEIWTPLHPENLSENVQATIPKLNMISSLSHSALSHSLTLDKSNKTIFVGYTHVNDASEKLVTGDPVIKLFRYNNESDSYGWRSRFAESTWFYAKNRQVRFHRIFKWDRYFYLIFSEEAIDNSNKNNPEMITRIARICENDPGFKAMPYSRNAHNSGIFTSFRKLTLTCSVDGLGARTQINLAQTIVASQPSETKHGDSVFYLIMSTDFDGSNVSGVCAYSLKMVNHTFSSGSYSLTSSASFHFWREHVEMQTLKAASHAPDHSSASIVKAASIVSYHTHFL